MSDFPLDPELKRMIGVYGKNFAARFHISESDIVANFQDCLEELLRWESKRKKLEEKRNVKRKGASP